MDVKKIGIFLSDLRKEKGLTQDQLGEQLGVTNKTVSRWENGNYLPTVEILKLMSELYDISINEILCAQRLEERSYKVKAEENIQTVLRSSSFTVHEKIDYYKKKWFKDHIVECVIGILAMVLAYVVCVVTEKNYHLLASAALTFFVIWKNNQMMAYVESHVYEGIGKQ